MFEAFGIKIIEHPLLPKEPRMQLSPEICKILAPAFVEETNKWMEDFFGYETVAYIFDMNALGLGYGNTMFLDPATAAIIKDNLF